jgi:hypothetical protein
VEGRYLAIIWPDLNNKLIRKLYADSSAWEEVKEKDIKEIPISYWTAALGKT